MTINKDEPATAADDALATLSVEDAGRALGLGRNLAYQMASKGRIPTIRFGRLLRVPRAALVRLLAEVGQQRG